MAAYIPYDLQLHCCCPIDVILYFRCACTHLLDPLDDACMISGQRALPVQIDGAAAAHWLLSQCEALGRAPRTSGPSADGKERSEDDAPSESRFSIRYGCEAQRLSMACCSVNISGVQTSQGQILCRCVLMLLCDCCTVRTTHWPTTTLCQSQPTAEIPDFKLCLT
jgi:hypothetical protein